MEMVRLSDKNLTLSGLGKYKEIILTRSEQKFYITFYISIRYNINICEYNICVSFIFLVYMTRPCHRSEINWFVVLSD